MIVVSDTGPINYLLLMGVVEVLPKLFEKVILPARVAQELISGGAPATHIAWIENLLPGFEIRSATTLDSAINLDDGEREAICLAEELSAAALLMDERKGRAVARQRGLAVVGTIGILEKAAELQLLDLEAALSSLRRTSFFGSDELFQAALERARRRQQ